MTGRLLIASLFYGLIGAMAAPALAEVKAGDKTIDCYCTDRTGSRVELGEFICLQVDGRMFTARCEMSLNNPMWREIRDGCLSSGLGNTLQPLQPVADTGPVDAEI